MLVLTRKSGEAIVISNSDKSGEEIEIKIVEITGDKIKLGITAGKDYKILRKELVQTAEINQESACGKVTADMRSFMAKF